MHLCLFTEKSLENINSIFSHRRCIEREKNVWHFLFREFQSNGIFCEKIVYKQSMELITMTSFVSARVLSHCYMRIFMMIFHDSKLLIDVWKNPTHTCCNNSPQYEILKCFLPTNLFVIARRWRSSCKFIIWGWNASRNASCQQKFTNEKFLLVRVGNIQKPNCSLSDPAIKKHFYMPLHHRNDPRNKVEMLINLLPFSLSRCPIKCPGKMLNISIQLNGCFLGESLSDCVIVRCV